jgi:hypothetical protein
MYKKDMKRIYSTSLDSFLFFLEGWPRSFGFAIYEMDYFAGNCKSSFRPHCTYWLKLCGVCSTCGYIMGMLLYRNGKVLEEEFQ